MSYVIVLFGNSVPPVSRGQRLDSLQSAVNSVDVVVKLTARRSGFRMRLVVPEFGRTVFEINDSVAKLSLSSLFDERTPTARPLIG